MVKAADKNREEKKAAEESAKVAIEKAKVKAAAEDQKVIDKVLADKKAVVQGNPVAEIPKAEFKPLMTSDQAKANIAEEKKDAADDKQRADADAARLKSQSSIGEKKVATEEVPVAKCPLELKKDKADAEKATKEAEDKAATLKMEAAAAEKLAAFEKEEASKDKTAKNL
jgi:hypothetical protein